MIFISVTAGFNFITRRSVDSSITSPDRVPFTTLIKAANQAVEQGTDMPDLGRGKKSGFPHRLFLPRGTQKGQEFLLFVMVRGKGSEKSLSEGSVENAEADLHECKEGTNESDEKAFGYPLDRRIKDERLFSLPNMNWSTVKIYFMEK